MKKPIYLIYHIPKTGGDSVISFFQSHLDEDRDFIFYSAKGLQRLKMAGRPSLEEREVTDLNRIKAVIGHEVTHRTATFFTNRDCRFSTILREPVARLTSELNYALTQIAKGRHDFFSQLPWVRDREAFHTTLTTEGRLPESDLRAYVNTLRQRPGWPDFQCFWLTVCFPSLAGHTAGDHPSERAKAILDRFWLVGTTNRIEKYAAILGKALDLPKFEHHTNKSTKYVSQTELKAHFKNEMPAHDRILFDYFAQRFEKASIRFQ
ncbi:hypothetical protein SCOR_18845 [Sulfidibacter corallicola]|uniref:Sulfotransferase family protein n=1 Tax=Sulfidibacter corallicola TaxID=2818388 RepID=A0A8A4U418_SULCO|nr:hypothetical protein [Sulfidibacter corallicola]QTD53495.1 hypothetical protein J3U87_13655 [Sulfidibacter corallicola]